MTQTLTCTNTGAVLILVIPAVQAPTLAKYVCNIREHTHLEITAFTGRTLATHVSVFPYL